MREYRRMNVWDATVSKRTLFRYSLGFAVAGWFADIGTSILSYWIYGLTSEANPLVRGSLLTYPIAVITAMFLLPVVLVSYTVWLYRDPDPLMGPRLTNAILVSLIVIGVIHSSMGALNLVNLIINSGQHHGASLRFQ